jgi:N-acetyl-D-muramate 6-phosphate phosphatase
MFSGVEAVLFDLDGTLIDSAPDLGAAANKMRLDRGMDALPLDLYRPMAGAGARGMLGIAFGMTSADPEFENMREEFFVNYENCMTMNTYAFSDVPELIEKLLARGLAWGVVTNKSMRFTGPLTRQMSLFKTASTIVGGDTTQHAKPHPAPLLEAARRLKLDPARCLYVGDDERDVVAGRAAGMGTVAASYGYLGGNGDPLQWGANAHIDAPLALLALLQTSSQP